MIGGGKEALIGTPVPRRVLFLHRFLFPQTARLLPRFRLRKDCNEPQFASIRKSLRSASQSLPPRPALSSTAGGTKFLCFTRQRIMPRLSIPLILDDNERNVILRPVMLQARDSFIPRIRARGMILAACRLCLVNEIQRRAA